MAALTISIARALPKQPSGRRDQRAERSGHVSAHPAGLCKSMSAPQAATAPQASGVLKLNYLPIRARGEIIRLTLAALRLPWEEVHMGCWEEDTEGLVNIAWNADGIKQDLDRFEFMQAPSVTIGGESYSQSNAILRHLGRKHNLYGRSEGDALRIDTIIDGVEDLRRKFVILMYLELVQPNGLTDYWGRRGDPATMTNFNDGAHLGFLNRLVTEKCCCGSMFVLSGQLTIADIALFDIVDCHLLLFPEQMKAEYPLLVKHHAFIKGLPAIQDYMQSDKRYPHVYGTDLLEDDKLQQQNFERKRAAVADFREKVGQRFPVLN